MFNDPVIKPCLIAGLIGLIIIIISTSQANAYTAKEFDYCNDRWETSAQFVGCLGGKSSGKSTTSSKSYSRSDDRPSGAFTTFHAIAAVAKGAWWVGSKAVEGSVAVYEYATTEEEVMDPAVEKEIEFCRSYKGSNLLTSADCYEFLMLHTNN